MSLPCASTGVPAAHLADSTLTSDVALRSTLVAQYYQHRLKAALAHLQDTKVADQVAPLVDRLHRFRDGALLGLVTPYRGRFVLSHMDLYPKNMLADVGASSA